MKRIHRIVTARDVARWIADGQGEGEGANYKEWMGVRDFPSSGNTYRAASSVTGHDHTLFSKTEWTLFLSVERMCIEFKAQKSIPRDITAAAASKLGVAHPVFVPGTEPWVVTVDALVRHRTRSAWAAADIRADTAPDNLSLAIPTAKKEATTVPAILARWGVLIESYDELLRIARSHELVVYDSKLEADLADQRVLELLSVSRLSSEYLGWRYFLVTDKVLPESLRENLEWIRRGSRKKHELDSPSGLFNHYPRLMLQDIRRQPAAMPLAQYCGEFEVVHGLPSGIGLRVLQILLWNEDLLVDPMVPNLESRSISALRPKLAVVGQKAA